MTDRAPDGDDLQFAAETPRDLAATAATPWKVLIVDDEEDVHAITRIVLDGCEFEGRALTFLSAYSAHEARALLAAHPDVAVMLLDVVMETESSGLDLVRHVRNELHNRMVRIILRTGQPGQAPEKQVIIDYDINDYKEKTELTAQKLITAIIAALRSYRDLCLIRESQQANLALKEEIAHRKRIEAQLKESEEVLREAKKTAETANRAKSVFLANMSHELRTPMNAILGFAQLLKNDPALNDEQRAKVDTIARSGHHLLTLINDVLEISKIEAGKVMIEPRAFDMFELFDAIREIIQLHAERKDLALAIELPPDLPHYVKGDDKKLRQVLINLLGNAVKFTANGSIRLRVTIEPGADERIRFEVIDTGCGVAPDDLMRIFDAFYQTADSARRGEGTGLGLTISREYVALMGGTLEAASEFGKGSTFRFAIPLHAVPAVQIETRRRGRRVIGLAPGQPRYRILVAEDRPDNRQLLQQLLESVGFEVRTAENGERAMNLFHSWRPHLIWMDMRMPVMDGYEATRRIKASPAGRDTAVLALTASAFEEDRAEVLATGCDGFLRKPLDVDEVFAAMAEHLGVRYEYAAEARPGDAVAPVALDRDALASVKPQLRAEISHAALLLDAQQARAAIAKLAEHAPELATALRRLVDDYRFDVLLRLCEEPRRVL